MSLPTLHWRKFARVWVSVTDDFPRRGLDTIYTMMSTGSYYNGASRTQGVDSAVSVSRYQNSTVTEAVYWSHATGSLTHKGIIAGQGVQTKTPTMASPDNTTLGAYISANLTKNAGAFNSWDSANPFTSGQSFGYWKFVATGVPVTMRFDIYECGEAVCISSGGTAGTDTPVLMGAIFDPQSSNASDAESDGRLYGMMTDINGVGNDFYQSTLYEAGGNTNRFTEHTATNELSHCGVFNPGLSSLDTMQRSTRYYADGQANWTTRGGAVVGHMSIPFRKAADRRFRGSSRQWGPTKYVPIGAVFQSGGIDVAYSAMGNSIYSSGQNIALAY